MHKYIICLLLVLFPFVSSAKLLDKIAAIVNDRVITLSEVNRFQESYNSRKNVVPFIYKEDKPTKAQAIDYIIKSYIVRDHLNKILYPVSDDRVEAQIQETEAKLGLTRTQLLEFLQKEGLTFDEYFDLIKQTLEHRLFTSQVIAPLISITDQEVKNFYLKKFQNSKTMSFEYDLMDFIFDADKLSSTTVNSLPKILKSYRENGHLPSGLESMETAELEDVRAENLDPEVKEALSKASEKEFAQPVKLGEQYHVFFVQKKELQESEEFLKQKPRLEYELQMEKASSVADSWFEQQYKDYFIKNFI